MPAYMTQSEVLNKVLFHSTFHFPCFQFNFSKWLAVFLAFGLSVIVFLCSNLQMSELTGLKRSEAKKCITTLQTIGAFEMKKRGAFVLPGFCKFTVKSMKAKPARQGINPFTKEPCVFKAKPARKVVKVRFSSCVNRLFSSFIIYEY
jgi:DNA-binding protein HU-beta